VLVSHCCPMSAIKGNSRENPSERNERGIGYSGHSNREH
jgi:hypothetical protein